MANIIISHLGEVAFDSVVTINNEDKPALLWAAIVDRFASESVNNKARVWLQLMRYEYNGNLKDYLGDCQKMINEFAVVQLGIPDDIISISILAKLSKDLWNVVDNIIMNESIVFYPSLTLKKLQELVFMKEARSIEAATTSKTSSSKSAVKEEGASAYKAESKNERPKPKHPCSDGKHNPLAYHPSWRCFKLSQQERDALRPKEDPQAHSSAVEEAHATNAKLDQSNDNYIEVSAYLSHGYNHGNSLLLNSGASHHMVNNPNLFKKIKEVNINIQTGCQKQRVWAVAMGEAFIKDQTGVIIKLSDVLLAPDLHRSLISMNRLFKQDMSITKDSTSFLISLDEQHKLSGKIANNLLELDAHLEIQTSFSSYLSTTVPIDWHTRLGHPHDSYLKRIVPNTLPTECETCKLCKSVKKPFSGKFTPTSSVLEAIHLDLVGPFQTCSVTGCQYFLTIVDQHSRFKSVKLLHHKSETLNKIEEYVAWAENQTGQTVKRIISDNGGEFKNIYFEEFC